MNRGNNIQENMPRLTFTVNFNWKTLLVAFFGISFILLITFRENDVFTASTDKTESTTKILQKIIVDNRDGHMGPYAMSREGTDFSEGQSAVIHQLLNGKKNGTFFEAGAFDGEFLSNTYMLERQHGFTGLLVEPQKRAYDAMLTRHRHAAMLNGCISPTGQIYNATMNVSLSDNNYHRGSSALSGRSNGDRIPVDGGKYESLSVTCYPLFNILEAAGLTKLDVFCLDVQGVEPDILQTMPWEKVDIKLLLLEIGLPTAEENRALLEKLKGMLEKPGYKMVRPVGLDYVFMKTPSA